MAEIIINIAPEKEALLVELVEQLGGNIVQKKEKNKKEKIKKGAAKIDHTFLFGKWKDFDIDARKLRDELWRKS